MPAAGETSALGGPLDDLTEAELAAVISAASWYANYHAHGIAEQAGDQSAYATARRERFADLARGLSKLGVRVPPSLAALERTTS